MQFNIFSSILCKFSITSLKNDIYKIYLDLLKYFISFNNHYLHKRYLLRIFLKRTKCCFKSIMWNVAFLSLPRNFHVFKNISKRNNAESIYFWKNKEYTFLCIFFTLQIHVSNKVCAFFSQMIAIFIFIYEPNAFSFSLYFRRKNKEKYEMANTKHLLWKMMVIYVKSSNKRYKLKKKFRSNERGREMWKIFRTKIFAKVAEWEVFTVRVLILNLRFRRIFYFTCCISFLNLLFWISELMLFI